MPVYRIPPYKMGPNVLLAEDVTDRQPWSLVSCNVPQQWADTQGEGVTVAVLDTGLWKHRDLPDPVFAVNCTDSGTVYDRQGHGSHVAGTVGARLDGAGVVGWAPKCDLACVKVLGDDGSGADDWIAKGLDVAVANGAHIISMSLGGGYSRKIADACTRAVAAGVFVIVAAGNEGQDGGQNTVGWPARLDAVAAIASYRRDGGISDFSSYGPEVDMAFPGEDILSTWLNNTFRSISGTSMATPAASGLTALMLAWQRKQLKEGKIAGLPIKNNADLIRHWSEHAIDAGAPGRDIRFGWGVPDVDGIIRGAGKPSEPPPTPPTPPPQVPPGFTIGGIRVEVITHEGRSGVFIHA